MPQKCVVPQCGNTSYKHKGLPFFRLPRKDEERQRGIAALQLDASQLKETSTVCFAHFDRDAYFTFNTKHKLKPGRVPQWNRTTPASPAPPAQAETIAEGKSDTSNNMATGRPNKTDQKRPKIKYYQRSCGHLWCREEAPFRIEKFMHSNKKSNYYTRIQTFQILRIIFKLVLKSEKGPQGVMHHKMGAKKPPDLKQHKLTPLNEFFLTLIMKRYQICSVFHPQVPVEFWVNLLYNKLASVKIWPHRDVIIRNAPGQFIAQYPGVIGSINCTEFCIQTPSHYKGTTTVKGLIMIDPNGAIIFVSALFTGSISDKRILEESRFCEVLQRKLQNGELSPGDIILADKGFNVRSLTDTIGITLNIPTFRITGSQFEPEEVSYSRTIAHERIHVERAIRRLKAFSILSHRIPVSLLGSINQIYTVCALLTNFRYPLRH